MAEKIEIKQMEPRTYGVVTTEGTTTTSHRVHLTDGILESVAPDPDDANVQEVLVRESIKFLLERETAAEILPEFSLDDITRYFPEYPEEIRSRMAAL